MNRPADAEARQRALLPDLSFAVTAPAGSGKTGLLTQRVLQLLACCEQPEEVLCITFTRKAAAEMQQRIAQAIIRATATEPPADPHELNTWQLAQAVIERDREQGWNLLLAPNRLRVQTIDGLARSLARQLPLASGLGALPDALEQPAFAYRLAVRETLKLLEQESSLQEDLRTLLRHFDNNLDTIEALLVALLAKRDQWLGPLLSVRDARAYLEAVLATLVEETLQQVSQLLRPWASDLGGLADYAGTHLSRDPANGAASALAGCAGLTGLPEAMADALPQWMGLVELLLNKGNDWRSRFDVRCGFAPGSTKAEKAQAKERKAQMGEIVRAAREVPGLLEQLQSVRRLPAPAYSDRQWQLLESLTRLLPVLAAQLKIVFGQLGATDFIEITQAALLALGQEESPSELALKLDYRIRHILVDEFQDTASPQLQLLEKLTEGWQPGDGRTLFIVGDGMQSCYAFRNANVGIFLDARQHGIGSVALEPLDLEVNFRSYTGIVNWVNRVFERAFPAQSDINRGAVRYAKSVAFKPDLLAGEPGGNPSPATRAVSVIGCVDAPDRRREAAQVVEIVQRHQHRQPSDRIAILVRNRAHLTDILAALRRAGIPWQATDIDPLASRMAVVDVMSLTRALLDPGDRIAWLSVLRAPWCGLDMFDLHALATADLGELNPRAPGEDYPLLWPQLRHHRRIAAISPAGQRILARVSEVFEAAWRSRRRKPLRYWLEGIWLALGGPAALAEAEDVDNIPRYFDLLERYEQGGLIPDWEVFEQAVAQLYALPQAHSGPGLQVMTIHKSKGLEFDTVIIPGLDRLARQDEHQLLLWQERITYSGEKQLLLGPLAATGEEQDGLYSYMRQERALRGQLESNRLLYVGCTRAIKHLYLLANVASKSNEEEEAVDGDVASLNSDIVRLKSPPPQSLLACIWEAVKDEVMQRRDTVAPKQVQEDLFAQQAVPAQNYILRLRPDWTRPPLAPDTALQDYRGREYQDEENIPEPDGFDNRVARHTGTVIHRALRRIVLDGVQAWNERRLAEQHRFWQLQLRGLGVAGQALKSSVEKVHTAVSNALADTTGRWLLDNSHTDSACELSLWKTSPRVGGLELRESIIDRTFVHEGYRWIIDYKSSEPAQGQSARAFCESEAEAYRAQLWRYAELFQELGPEPVRVALYFPLLPLLYEVEFAILAPNQPDFQ